MFRPFGIPRACNIFNVSTLKLAGRIQLGDMLLRDIPGEVNTNKMHAETITVHRLHAMVETYAVKLCRDPTSAAYDGTFIIILSDKKYVCTITITKCCSYFSRL